MNPPRSQGAFLLSLGLAFLVGIGAASTVYWLLVVPAKSDQLTASGVQSPAIETESVVYAQPASTDESSASNPTTVVPRNLDDLEQVKSSFERGLALRSLLAESDENEVVELYEQTQDAPRYSPFNGMQMAVVQRLAQLNPKRALRLLGEMDAHSYPGQYVGSVYQEWAQSNLDDAVAHARTLDSDWKSHAVSAIVHARKDLSEEVLKSIARDLGNEQIAITAIAQKKIEDAIGDPERAWNELAVEMQNDMQHTWSISRVATAWVEKSGLSVLDQIYQSLTNSEVRQYVMRSVLGNAAQTDPAGAFKFALTIENDQYGSIIRNVAFNWAVSDPQAALSAVSEVEKRALRRELEDYVVSTWASHEPREVLDQLDTLPEHVQGTATTSAIGQIAQDSHDEAIRLVLGMEFGDTRTSAAQSVISAWWFRDSKAALDWVLNEPAIADIQHELLSGVMHRLVMSDPERAMSVALAIPIEEGENGGWSDMGMEMQVISQLSYTDLDKAIELLPRVRKGPTMLQAYRMVSGALIREGEIDEALNMAQQLPESDRTDFYASITTAWAREDPEGMLNSMNRLPTKEARSKGVMSLIYYNRFEKKLTNEQIEEARKYLTDEDAKDLKEQVDRQVMRGR